MALFAPRDTAPPERVAHEHPLHLARLTVEPADSHHAGRYVVDEGEEGGAVGRTVEAGEVGELGIDVLEVHFERKEVEVLDDQLACERELVGSRRLAHIDSHVT